MKITVLLLLAVGLVILDISSHVEAQMGGAINGINGIMDPCWNVRCRPGSYCVSRGGIGVCVRRQWRRPCMQPLNPGPCRGSFRRYFYNRFSGRCQSFIYGGCGGNQNNFYTWRQCQRTCVRRPWYPRDPMPFQPLQPIAEPMMYSSDPDS